MVSQTPAFADTRRRRAANQRADELRAGAPLAAGFAVMGDWKKNRPISGDSFSRLSLLS
jgi:hypothetical protein